MAICPCVQRLRISEIFQSGLNQLRTNLLMEGSLVTYPAGNINVKNNQGAAGVGGDCSYQPRLNILVHKTLVNFILNG